MKTETPSSKVLTLVFTDLAESTSDRPGKLVETFAFNEIMAQVDVGDGRYELFHYRDREKREIDFLIERENNAHDGLQRVA